MQTLALIVTLFSLLTGPARSENASEEQSPFTIVGFLRDISYEKQLDDLHSLQFFAAQQRLEQMIRQKLGSDAAKVTVAKFRQEENVYGIRGNGVEFYATLYVDKANYPTRQQLYERLRPTEDDAFKIFELSVGDHPLQDFDLEALGWDMSLIEEEKTKYDERGLICANGGALLANGSCLCLPYFTGPYCQKRVCVNAGFSTTNYPRCACPPGYPGLHCEPLPCSPTTTTTFDFSKRSLLYVISQRDSMALDINGIIAATANLTTSFQMSHPGFFDSFISVSALSYDSNAGYYSKIVATRNVTQFIDSLTYLSPISGDRYQPILTAISTALSASPILRPRSPVYIFADAMASDIQLELQVIQQAISWNAKLFFILTNLVDSSVYPSMNTSDPGYLVYQRLAVATGGELIVLNFKTDVEPLLEAFTMYQYDTETILSAHRFPCNSYDQRQIDLDNGLTQYYLHTVATGLLVIDNTTGTPVPLNPSYHFGTWSLYIVSRSVYTLDFHTLSSTDCTYRVFIPSNQGALLGYTPVPVIDSYAAVTSAEVPHSLVARITTDTPWSSVSITYLNEDATSSVAFAPGAPLNSRENSSCVFPLIFRPWQNCTVGPYSANLFISLKGGNFIERSYPAYCFPPQYAVQPTSGPAVCQNGGTINPLDGSCQCPELFSGDHCEVTKCINGATQVQYPAPSQLPCTCLPGYTGVHCETLFCGTNASLNMGSRNFAVVMEISYGMSSIVTEVRGAINQTMPLFDSNHPGYFSSYILTTFYKRTVSGNPSSTNEITSSDYPDAKSFVDGLRISPGYTLATEHPIMEAINTTLSKVSQGTPIFIYTSSAPSDTYFHQVLTLAIQLRTPLYFILTSPFADTVSNPCLNSTSVGYMIYNHLAMVTGGLLLNFCGRDYNQPVQNFTSIFASMQYNLETVSLVDQNDCSAGIQETFAAQSTNAQFYFVLSATGNSNPMLTIRDKNNVLTPLSPYQSFYGNVYMYQATNLPAGIYSLLLSNTMYSCSLRIYELSSATVVYGFSPDPSVDMQSAIAHIGMQVHPVVHGLVPVSSPETVLTVAIYDMEQNQLYLSASEYRSSGCNYESYLVGAFTCTSPANFFYVKFIFQDQISQLFTQRMRTGYCMEMAFKTCLNDGTFNEVVQRCQCHAYWDGTYCEIPHCFNGGTVDAQAMGCICPLGYNGFHCEFGSCSSFNLLAASEPPTFYYRSIAFVVQSTYDNGVVRQQLANGIQSFLNQLSLNGDSEQQLSLVTFDRQSVTNVISTADPDVFQAVFSSTLLPTSKELEEYYQMKGSKESLFDPAMSFEAIDQAVEMTFATPAIIYVITGVPANYTSFDQPRHISDHLMASNNNIQINYIGTPITTPPKPTPGNATDAMNQIISFTNGRVIYTGIKSVTKLLTNYLAKTVSENALISEFSYDDCTNGITQYFPIETRANWFTVAVQGVNAQVSLSDASGNNVTINATTDVLQADAGGIIVYFPQSNRYAYAGIWTITATTTQGGCRLQVRAASSLQLEIGYTLDETSDFPISTPFAGKSTTNRALVKLPISLQDSIALQYFKAYDILGSSPVLRDTATMNRRDSSCAYQWYSDIFHSDLLGFGAEILGTDENGYPFKRVQASIFLPHECQNNGTLTNSKCVCPALWTGFDCRYPVCLNGGTLDVSVCNCQNGYYGLHCENALTLPPVTGSMTTTTATTSSAQPTTSTTTTTTSSQTTTTTTAPDTTTTTTTTTTAPSTTTTTTSSPQTTTTTTTVSTTTSSLSPSTANPGCDMSTLQWDIVLLFDVSATAMANNKMLLNLFKDTSLAFSGNFIMGGNGAQVALAEYADAAYVTTKFNTITSQDMLNGAINNAIGSGAVAETSDIRLGSALQLVNDQLIIDPSGGLRKGVRHMVIFSAEVQPSDISSAIGLARQLHNQCVYTIGLAASGVDLSSIVGGTDFTTSLNSLADVTTVINWLNQKACTLPACPPTN